MIEFIFDTAVTLGLVYGGVRGTQAWYKVGPSDPQVKAQKALTAGVK